MRNLNPKLKAWLDARVEATDQPRLLFRRAMRGFVGVRESGGNNKGEIVELIQDTVGHAEGEPWCMSLVQSALAYVETVLGVKSPVAVGEHCLTVWRDTPHAQRVRFEPLPGAIIIWKHGDSFAGHTGIFEDSRDGKMLTIEGNTESGLNELGSLVREGGGVYECVRDRHANGSMRVMGFLKPF